MTHEIVRTAERTSVAAAQSVPKLVVVSDVAVLIAMI
jgi:hypothetical protein